MDIREKLIEFEKEIKTDMMTVSNDRELVLDSYQDAYIKIDTYIKSGREFFYVNNAAIKSLLKLTCRNILLDKLRKKQRSKVSYTDQTYSMIDYTTPEDSFIEIEQAQNDPYINKKLNDSFIKMNHDIYMTYKLRQKGMSFKDIAYMTDTSVNTALGRMRYAQLRIQREFTNDGG